MCDQTEVPYLPGDIVWVKLGPVWWPGKVCNNDEIPPEVFKELRKTPIAIVKFFQEESLEYVKKLSTIYHYNCLKKNDFIRKGLNVLRSSNRDKPSNMHLFPEDVATAEVLTGGNPNIIHDEMFLPEKRPSYAADFAPTPKKTPKKIKIERKKEIPTPKPVTPRVITHPRFIRHGVCDYEARERKQVPLRAECDEEDNSPPTTYRCPDCDFTTIRLNVIVLHNKSHVRNYASQHTSVKGIKRKSTSTIRHKDKRPAIERKSTDVVKSKTLKTPGEKPKTPKKKSPVELLQKESSDATPPKVVEVHKPVAKKKRAQPNTDEFQNSLLEDWAEFENEQEGNEDSTISEDFNDSTASSSKTGKSCFDFDDSEDGLVIDKSKIRAGRKIPRVLEDARSDKDEDSNAFSELSTSMDDQISSSDGNRNGIDSNDEQEYAETRKTSQLQEMGVDNEIEIDCEEDNDNTKGELEVDTADIPLPPAPEPDQAPDPKKEQETEELKQKVTKLLEEISVPPKLPDIPYSMKKAHIKSFNESEELARREAEKNQAAASPKPEPDQVTEEAKSQQPVEAIEAEAVQPTSTEPVVVPQSESIQPSEPESVQSTEPEIVQPAEPEIVQSTESEIVQPTESEIAKPVESPKLSEPSEPIVDQPSSDIIAVEKEVQQPINNTADKVAEHLKPSPQTTPSVEVVKSTITTPQESGTERAKAIKIVVGNAGSTNQIVLTAATQAVAANHTTTPVKTIPTGQVKVVTTPKFKLINQAALNKAVGSPTKVIPASTVTSADGKAVSQTLLSKIPGVDGKTVVNLSAPQKFIINKGKSMIVDAKQLLNCQTLGGQKIRVIGPNILQKTAAVRAQVATAAKTPTRSITLPSNLTGSNVVVLQPQKPILLTGSSSESSSVVNSATAPTPDTTTTEISFVSDDSTAATKNYRLLNTVSAPASAANSNATRIVAVDLNQTNNLYITDQSGNLIISDGGNATVPNNPPLQPKEDILAKALENTDVLQADIALADVSQSVLDTISVAQNTPLTFKSDAVYDTNLTLNTPPIMSSFETPSRALNAAAVLAEAVSNEMIILNDTNDNNEFIT